jgi:hypothetical protein
MTVIDEIDGIVVTSYKKIEYKFWNKSKVVLPSIYQFLRTTFPNSIILPEFNHIDFVVLDENLPVEVQSTPIQIESGSTNKKVGHSIFERRIQKQITENIERYGKCWFFFDSEFLKYLQSATPNYIETDFGWLTQYVKNDMLKVFTVNYEGFIKDVSINDLSPIVNEYTELDRNKIKIISSVLIKENYTSKEIRDFSTEKKLSGDKKTFYGWLRKSKSSRMKNLGNILNSIYFLKQIDEFFENTKMLDVFFSRKTNWESTVNLSVPLKIFKYEPELGICVMEDKHDILKYFPGYIKNKTFWDSKKHEKISRKTI